MKKFLLLPALLFGMTAFAQEPNQQPQDEKPQMATPTLDKFEITQFGPYRFIGKSVYARAGGFCVTTKQSDIFGGLWKNSAWIFEALDNLKEYATDEVHNAALLTWEKFDEKSKLLGYTVGRFMKADTPVPEGMDYFDIPATFVGKGWVKAEPTDNTSFLKTDELTEKAITQQNYNATSWKWSAEVYPAKKSAPDENGGLRYGTYINCEKQ